MLFPVVFIHVQCKSGLFFYTHHRCKLEEVTFILMRSRLSDSDKSSAVVNKFLDCCDDRLIRPVVSACVCSICITDIQYHIDVI